MKSLERNNQDLKNELIKNENHTKSIHGDWSLKTQYETLKVANTLLEQWR
jgi:hypothetical protein